MKTVLTAGVVFTPGSKALDFAGVPAFDKRRLLAVLHQPTGRTLYAAGTPALAGSFAGSVLTLAVDTAGLGANDPLTILYEAAAETGLATDATLSGLMGADGASPPAIAGTGVRGWLRAILETLKSPITVQGAVIVSDGSGPLTVDGTVGLGAGSAVIGRVGLQVGGADAGPANPLTIAGASAVGSAPVNPPLSVSGVDGGGLKRHVLTDATGKLQVVDASNTAFSAATVMTAGSSSPAGRSVGVNCTTSGVMTLTLAGGSTIPLPVSPGWQTFPFAATQFAFDSAAAGVVYNLA